jgi:hypothetical protein
MTMQYYRMGHPEYATDQAMARANPMSWDCRYAFPALDCSACGGRCCNSHLRVSPDRIDDPSAFGYIHSLPADHWFAMRPVWAAMIGVDESLIEPGMEVGMPLGELRGRVKHDFNHPLPGLIWVRQAVKDMLTEADATGVDFAPVTLTPTTTRARQHEIPQLWELIVPQQELCDELRQLRMCPMCGGIKGPIYWEMIDNNDLQKSGRDFCCPCVNANLIAVSPRIKELIESARFTNVHFEPARANVYIDH